MLTANTVRVASQVSIQSKYQRNKTMNSSDLLLYAITDRSRLGENEPLSKAVEAALEGGITLLQLREKNMPDSEVLPCAKEILGICHRHGVKLIINDNVYMCKEIDADGVHLGQGDMPLQKARAILGDDKIIGVTAKTVLQATTAQNDGADYLGCGAMFVSPTKKDAIPMNNETLKEISNAVDIPVVAIGGIDESNINTLEATGISGVAVVSAIFAKNDKKAAAEYMLKKVKEIV